MAVPIILGPREHPRDRAILHPGRHLRQRFFVPGRPVEHEEVRYVGYCGVFVALGSKAKVENGVKGYAFPQPPRVPDTTRRTDRRQNALFGAGYLREERWYIAARLDALPRTNYEQSGAPQD